jgi:glyoxylase-like metal-dependent hydrolase (beta-lactamase superfamily II)
MIRSRGQQAIVTGDLMHHALQCRESDWSTIFDTAAQSRRRLLGQVADTRTFVLPIHFPNPTTGLVSADGERFHYTFAR